MFTSHFQLNAADAEVKLRTALELGDEVAVLGLFFRYQQGTLAVRVPSSVAAQTISSVSAFEDLIRAQTLLHGWLTLAGCSAFSRRSRSSSD